MPENQELTNLEQLLDRLREASEEGGQVSWRAVLREAGQRSFGPILLVAGITTLAPLVGDIPGVPTIIGAIVFLVAVQLLMKRDHFWLPDFLLERSVEKGKLHKALDWLQRPAHFIDRFLRPRLTILTRGSMVYLIAVVCLGIAAAMPVMEMVPFSANAAGAALTAYGLSLIAHDGLLALIALALTAAIIAVLVYNFI